MRLPWAIACFPPENRLLTRRLQMGNYLAFKGALVFVLTAPPVGCGFAWFCTEESPTCDV